MGAPPPGRVLLVCASVIALLLRDTEEGATLFMGRVACPSTKG